MPWSAILGVAMIWVWRLTDKVVYIYIYIRKSVGEITEPCGTPAFVENDSDDIPSTTTLILWLVRKLSIHAVQKRSLHF